MLNDGGHLEVHPMGRNEHSTPTRSSTQCLQWIAIANSHLSVLRDWAHWMFVTALDRKLLDKSTWVRQVVCHAQHVVSGSRTFTTNNTLSMLCAWCTLAHSSTGNDEFWKHPFWEHGCWALWVSGLLRSNNPSVWSRHRCPT